MKPYKIPHSYFPWAKFLQHKELFSRTTPKKLDTFAEISVPENLAYMYGFCASGYPVYCVRSGLLNDIVRTDVGENLALFSDIHLSIPGYILFLPTETVKSPTGTGFINYIMVIQEEIAAHPEYRHVISWGGIDSEDCLFLSAKRIRRDGELHRSSFSTEDEQQQRNTLNLRNIVLQSLLGTSRK